MEDKCPLVSVITICYNSGNTIEQTLRSVVQQTYPNIEYIIVDGGSTDSTVEIIKRYADLRPYTGSMGIRWISEKDFGIYNAMNKGIRMASGEIIGIINSDDWYDVDAVEKMVKIASADPTAGVYHGGIRMYGERDAYLKYFLPDSKEQLNICMIPHPACFIRKSYYDKFGLYDESYKIAADYDLLARIYKGDGAFHQIPYLLANFRCSGISEKNKNISTHEEQLVRSKYGLTYTSPNRLIRKIKKIFRRK